MGADATLKVIDTVLALGLPGVIIIVLAIVVRSLWMDNKELHKSLNEVSVKSVQALEQNTAALTRLSDLLLRGKDV
jgi:hypothetical protein